MIYFGLIFLVIVQYFFIVGRSSSARKRKAYCWLCGVELFMLLGFRSVNIGHDSEAYADMFRIVAEHELSRALLPWLEYPFVVFTKFLSLFSAHPQILFLVTSAFIIWAVARLIYKYTEQPWIGFFVLLTFEQIMFYSGGIRQGIATAISFFAFDFIVKRKPFKFALMIAAAALFHNSSLFLLFLYPASLMNLTKKRLLLFMPVLGGVFFAAPLILKVGFAVMPSYTGYLDSYVTEAGFKLGVFIKIAISASVFLLGWFAQTTKTGNYSNAVSGREADIFKTLLNYSFFAVCLYIISLHGILFQRLAFYFDFFNIIFIPQIFYLLKGDKIKNLILILMITFILAYQAVLIKYRPDWNAYVPYEPFWENMDAVRTDVFNNKMEYLDRR